MNSVVSEGTGKNAKVEGYQVGGKTGTSEDGVNTGKYVTSFIGTAPISDPEVCILITLYNPTGEGGHQGGGVAAPIGSQVLGEVLPYLEIKKDNEQEEEKKEDTKKRRTSMKFLTALRLSLNNLMTKKGRTFLTSFAGSIGIIGIALILIYTDVYLAEVPSSLALYLAQ